MSALSNSLSHNSSSGTQTLPLSGMRERKKNVFLQHKCELCCVFTHRQHPRPLPLPHLTTLDLHLIAVVMGDDGGGGYLFFCPMLIQPRDESILQGERRPPSIGRPAVSSHCGRTGTSKKSWCRGFKRIVFYSTQLDSHRLTGAFSTPPVGVTGVTGTICWFGFFKEDEVGRIEGLETCL